MSSSSLRRPPGGSVAYSPSIWIHIRMRQVLGTMANQKKKQQKKKAKGRKGGKQARKPPPVPVPRMMANVSTKRAAKMSHIHATCSMTDPFCVHARGAQRVDGGPPTIPYQIRGIVPLVNWSTSGSTRYVFVPGVYYQYNGPATYGSNAWTMGAAWLAFTNAGDIMTLAQELRIVSFGCVIRCPLSATTAAGTVIVSTQPNPLVSETVAQGSMNNAEVQVHNVAAGMEVSWISKANGPSAHLFRRGSTFTSTMSDFDWTSLAIDVSGSTSTSGANLLAVEYVCNIEFTLNPQTTGLANLAKTAPAPNRAALAAADHVRAQTPSFIQGGIDTVATKVQSYATSALDSILSDGLALLFG